MAKPRLSARSGKAGDLARRLARREGRSIAEARREPASAFYARLVKDHGSDVDLEAVIRESRNVHRGPKL
jgi:hypothetical protein